MAITVPGIGVERHHQRHDPDSRGRRHDRDHGPRYRVRPTAPAAGGTVPTWTTPTNGSGVNNSRRLADRRRTIATATNHTSGTWTSAAQMHVLVLRPTSGNTLAVGDSPAQGGANNTQTMIYPAFTLTAGKVYEPRRSATARGARPTPRFAPTARFAVGRHVAHRAAGDDADLGGVHEGRSPRQRGAFTATPAGIERRLSLRDRLRSPRRRRSTPHSQPVNDAIAGTDAKASARRASASRRDVARPGRTRPAVSGHATPHSMRQTPTARAGSRQAKTVAASAGRFAATVTIATEAQFDRSAAATDTPARQCIVDSPRHRRAGESALVTRWPIRSRGRMRRLGGSVPLAPTRSRAPIPGRRPAPRRSRIRPRGTDAQARVWARPTCSSPTRSTSRGWSSDGRRRLDRRHGAMRARPRRRTLDSTAADGRRDPRSRDTVSSSAIGASRSRGVRIVTSADRCGMRDRSADAMTWSPKPALDAAVPLDRYVRSRDACVADRRTRCGRSRVAGRCAEVADTAMPHAGVGHAYRRALARRHRRATGPPTPTRTGKRKPTTAGSCQQKADGDGGPVHLAATISPIIFICRPARSTTTTPRFRPSTPPATGFAT